MIKKSRKSAKKLLFKFNLGKFVGENVLLVVSKTTIQLWQVDIY